MPKVISKTQDYSRIVAGNNLELSIQGFKYFENLFSREECNLLNNELDTILVSSQEKFVTMEENGFLRSVYYLHKSNGRYLDLVRDKRIIKYIENHLGEEVYVHQLAVNLKPSYYGGFWGGHQDFAVWNYYDGIPKPKPIIAAVYLSDVTYENGPISILPKTHKLDLRSLYSFPNKDNLDTSELNKYIEEYGVVIPTGPAGSVLFFNANTIHSSAANLSCHDRRIAIISYNAVTNGSTMHDRPVWKCERNFCAVSEISLNSHINWNMVHNPTSPLLMERDIKN